MRPLTFAGPHYSGPVTHCQPRPDEPMPSPDRGAPGFRGCILVVLLRTPAAAPAEFAVYHLVLEHRFPAGRIPALAVGRGQGPTAGDEMAVTAASVGRFRHLALFYHGRSEYVAVLAGFIQASLAQGDAVFVAIPEGNARLLRQELGEDSARLFMVDMAELGRNPARIIPAVMTYARQETGRPVSCIGEPIWPGRTAAEVLEASTRSVILSRPELGRQAPLSACTCACTRNGAPAVS
jgi:hypothetical protein